MKKSAKIGLVGWGLLLVGLVTWIVLPAPEPTAEEKAAVAAEEASCSEDLKCWGQRNHTSASIACLSAIDQAVGFRAVWNDGSDLKVRYHRWLDQEAKTLTYYGDALSVMNQLGVPIRQRFECDFDPASDVMTAFRMKPDSN